MKDSSFCSFEPFLYHIRAYAAKIKWYGWGSPIGLGIFILCLALTALIVAFTVNGLVKAGQQGIAIEEQKTRMQGMK